MSAVMSSASPVVSPSVVVAVVGAGVVGAGVVGGASGTDVDLWSIAVALWSKTRSVRAVRAVIAIGTVVVGIGSDVKINVDSGFPSPFSC